jgi:hypothetical protein
MSANESTRRSSTAWGRQRASIAPTVASLSHEFPYRKTIRPLRTGSRRSKSGFNRVTLRFALERENHAFQKYVRIFGRRLFWGREFSRSSADHGVRKDQCRKPSDAGRMHSHFTLTEMKVITTIQVTNHLIISQVFE